MVSNCKMHLANRFLHKHRNSYFYKMICLILPQFTHTNVLRVYLPPNSSICFVSHTKCHSCLQHSFSSNLCITFIGYFFLIAPQVLQSLPMRHIYLNSPAAHPVFITQRNIGHFVHLSCDRLAVSIALIILLIINYFFYVSYLVYDTSLHQQKWMA